MSSTTDKTKTPAASAPKRRSKPALQASAEGPVLSTRQTLAISRAIADPSRFEVLRIIAQGEARCSELRTCLPITAATLSHHMKGLESAGLIETTRTGKFVTATLRQDTWQAYLDSLRTLSL
jgi:ArsR family transcriptional regulator